MRSTLVSALCAFATFVSAVPLGDLDLIPRASNISTLEAGLKAVVSPNTGVYPLGTPEFANDSLRYTNYDRPNFDIAVEPVTEQDVSAIIKYASKHNVPFFVQGGGHGYAASLDIVQHAIQINFKHFNQASVDQNGVLTIGGAVTYGTVINTTYAAGYELTVGSCVCVGALGGTLGGGHGPLQSKYGLGQDSLISLRVVLADGSIVTTSATENTDLWYAMRGAGQSFGAVISARYQTYAATNKGLFLDVEWNFPSNQTQAVVSYVNSLAPHLPTNLGIFVTIGVNPATLQAGLGIIFLWSGPVADAAPYLAKFRDFGPLSESYAQRPWNELGYEIAGGAFGPNGPNCKKDMTRITYSANTASLDLTTFESIFNSLTDFATQYPDANNTQIVFEVFGQKAELAVPANTSAYATRPYDKILSLITVTYDDLSISNAADNWARTQRDKLFSTSGYDHKYVYMNYAHGDEGPHAYYGYDSARFSKLQNLKAKYDPKDVFFGYHDVPLP